MTPAATETPTKNESTTTDGVTEAKEEKKTRKSPETIAREERIANKVPRDVRKSKADQKVEAVIEFVKGAGHEVTYEEILEGTGLPQHGYDVCQFTLTALAYMGHVEKVGTPEGSGRPRVAWKWTGKK